MSLSRLCLLIGNSRWHWAIKKSETWKFLHTEPDIKKLNSLKRKLFTWSAVGPIPPNIELDPSKRIDIKDVPLKNLPTWLGIDSAL